MPISIWKIKAQKFTEMIGKEIVGLNANVHLDHLTFLQSCQGWYLPTLVQDMKTRINRSSQNISVHVLEKEKMAYAKILNENELFEHLL